MIGRDLIVQMFDMFLFFNTHTQSTPSHTQVMIVFVLSYSLLMFGAGYVISSREFLQNTNSVDSSSSSFFSGGGDMGVEKASKAASSSRRDKAKKLTTSSVLNISSLPNAYEGQMLDKVATTMETRLEKLLEWTFTVI